MKAFNVRLQGTALMMAFVVSHSEAASFRKTKEIVINPSAKRYIFGKNVKVVFLFFLNGTTSTLGRRDQIDV
jgi:hypothetical protein